MNDFIQFKVMRRVSVLFLILLMMIYGDAALFIIAAQMIFWVMVLRALKIQSKKRFKFYLIFLYFILVSSQTTFFVRYLNGIDGLMSVGLVKNAVGVFILYLPYLLEYFVTVKKYTEFYMPSVQEINTMSFGQLKMMGDMVENRLDGIEQLGKTVTPKRLFEIAEELPRHSATQYLNEGSLTEKYFEEAERSLEDPHLYIVISNTGSAASEIISVFTRKQYNHASVSFDRELKTIISYNGGEKVYPPGLNQEMVEFFNKKEDSSLIVYELDITPVSKERMIEKIREINEKGSAYNMLGLVLKTSLKPNIMFCSQFVYNMLKYAGIQYFEKSDGKVKPTDLVELDYHRKLRFCYEIHFNLDWDHDGRDPGKDSPIVN